MIRRSGQVCAHSAPIAPAWNFCSKIVQTLASADINTKGASAAISRQRIRPVRHQIQRASTTGNMITEGLLRVARVKKSKEKANCHQRAGDSVLECADMSAHSGEVPCSLALKPPHVAALQNRRWGALEGAPPCSFVFL